MQSHTVPRKLLEQFAYDDPLTDAKRLWRYEQGRPPYWKASPRTATRIDGHFTDPENAAKESELEERLNREFEDPVNKFLFEVASPGFVATSEMRRRLTFYVTLLFNRSEARRKASSHLQKVSQLALKQFIENESQVETVAAKWSMDLLLSGRVTHGRITREHVIATARACATQYSQGDRAQGSYIRMLEISMKDIDEKLFGGEWNYIRTTPDRPFIISDAPVTTWERTTEGRFSYGMGFHRGNVEVLLPISPLVCLHIQPDVERSRPCIRPSVRDVNGAQAAFATRFCFANVQSAEIDEMFQKNFVKAEIGVRSFTVWHRNYSNTMFEILMNDGRWPK